jgi:predicted TIM-barrel fold metal-dependent hydrolase
MASSYYSNDFLCELENSVTTRRWRSGLTWRSQVRCSRHETEALEVLVKRVGADRVVLGSDYPVGEPNPIEFVESCALSAQEKANIIGANAARRFGVEVAA